MQSYVEKKMTVLNGKRTSGHPFMDRKRTYFLPWVGKGAFKGLSVVSVSMRGHVSLSALSYPGDSRSSMVFKGPFEGQK